MTNMLLKSALALDDVSLLFCWLLLLLLLFRCCCYDFVSKLSSDFHRFPYFFSPRLIMIAQKKTNVFVFVSDGWWYNSMYLTRTRHTLPISIISVCLQYANIFVYVAEFFRANEIACNKSAHSVFWKKNVEFDLNLFFFLFVFVVWLSLSFSFNVGLLRILNYCRLTTLLWWG